MSGSHPDIGPELRQLAQTILDTLDPAVRFAAARAAEGQPSRCDQVWCPVCALAALANGEQHPLLTVVAEHSVALLAVLRAMAHSGQSDPPEPPDPSRPEGPRPDPPGPRPADEPPSPSGPGRYQHIPVTIDEN